MNFSAGKTRPGRGAPVVNMTPLVDVVLQLVIFFMVTAQFAVLPGLKLLLPELSSGSLVRADERLEVSVTSRNDVFFEGRPATLATLGDMLEQTGADGSKAVVLVSADRASDYGTVFQVIEALRLKSFNRVVMGATLPAAAADLSPAVQVPGPDGPALPSGPAADPAAPVPSGTATVPAAPAPAGPAADPAAPAPAGLEAATETPG